MRLEWIEDILAVLDTGSLARAAERRMLTQSAFTRRVRMIEDTIGTELFDRRRKPIRLLPGVEALAPELRDLSLRLRKMRYRLKVSTSRTGGTLRFACQHAITTTVSPWIVRALMQLEDISVRVRSGNQDECMVQLLAGEVDFAVMYTVPGDQTVTFKRAFEARQIGSDVLVPVCAPGLKRGDPLSEIPTISYPSDVFLGQVFDRKIAPRLPSDITFITKAESALTLAAYEFALGGIGVAWLPRSLAADAIAQERLISLAADLPVQPLGISAIRLQEGQDARDDMIWQAIVADLTLPAHLQSVPDLSTGRIQAIE
ncbi:LysR family transcriptional regulator [Yoonia sp.]|uniref:LysR family transcriptional regulator n=1 Tax=Yoonia sp. TaxID=2212373 RepID=UPI0019E88295|nr:LysR family transcriptional regulator [Yoonia sp.]MBE0412760.1 LysR family transcriptional regulator [Yoonia sp.]